MRRTNGFTVRISILGQTRYITTLASHAHWSYDHMVWWLATLARCVPCHTGTILANSTMRAMQRWHASCLACILYWVGYATRCILYLVGYAGSVILYLVGYAGYPYQYGYVCHVGTILARGRCFLTTHPIRVPSVQRGGGPHQKASFAQIHIYLYKNAHLFIFMYKNSFFFYVYPRGYIDPVISRVSVSRRQNLNLKMNTLV